MRQIFSFSSLLSITLVLLGDPFVVFNADGFVYSFVDLAGVWRRDG